MENDHTTIRDKIIKKYSMGQVVKLWLAAEDGRFRIKKEVKIFGFYPYFVLVDNRGNRECFTYWDMAKLTRRKR